jgi:hypothetical protein
MLVAMLFAPAVDSSWFQRMAPLAVPPATARKQPNQQFMVYTRPIRRPLTFREPRKPGNCAIRATIDPEMSRGELGYEGWWSRQRILSRSQYTDDARDEILNFHYILQ